MADRIKLTDTGLEIVIKLAEGNPGAIRVCSELMNSGAGIDPDSAMGGMGNLLSFDTLGIYAERIWMLYKDVCGENVASVITLLRANQLGFLGKVALNHAIDSRGDGIDIPALYGQVKERLPKFDPKGLAAPADA